MIEPADVAVFTGRGADPLAGFGFPVNWPITTLGDLFLIQQGKALSQKHREGKSPRPFLRTANVLWGRLDLLVVDEMDFTEEEASRLSLQAGDLLVCEGGDVGRTALWQGEIEGCSYQNHVHRLRRKSEGVLPEFYMYWMQASMLHLGIYGGAENRTTIPNLSKGRLSQFQVPLPPLDHQRSIASILQAIQEMKASNERVVAGTRELNLSLMRHLFTYGAEQVSHADAVELRETEIGYMPSHWATANLGSVARISTGTTPSTANAKYWSGDVPFIKTAEIANNEITSAKSHITEEAVRDSRLKLYAAGTVFVAMYGQGKTRGQVGILRIAATTSQNTGAIVTGESLDPEFLWLYLLSRYEHLRSSGVQGHISHLNGGYLKQIVVPIPPLDEQHEISRILLAVRGKLSTEGAQVRALSTFFDTTMVQLVTHQREIVTPEAING